MARRTKAICTHVVDGDTIDIRYRNGRKARVRMIGVNTPESRDAFHKKKEPFGVEAKQYTIDRLEGRTIEIEFDKDRKDGYGRTLAYVYIDDEMFNKELVLNGCARVYTWLPNVKYKHILEDAQDEAYEAKVGLWQFDYFKKDEREHKELKNIKTFKGDN